MAATAHAEATGARRSPEDRPDLVADAALAALEQASGEQVRAAEILKERVEHDAKLKRALLDPLVAYACHQAVGLQIRAHRHRAWTGAAKAERAQPSQREQMLSIAAANLMLFPLPGGKMLGEASREEVLAGATFYATQAKDMAHKARWLKAVHDGMGNSATVAAAYDEARLVEMQKAAA